MADNWDSYYQAAADQYNIDPQLLRAIVSVESGGNPNAVSSKGAVGATQLMPKTSQALGVTNPRDPQQAIMGAAKLLDENLKRYGNTEDAIRAYHGGTNQANWGPKTQDYLGKVTAAYSGQPQSSDDESLLTQWASGSGSTPEDEKLLTDWAGKGVPNAPTVPKPAVPLSQTNTPLENFGAGIVQGVRSLTNTGVQAGAKIEDFLVRNNLINPPSPQVQELRSNLGFSPQRVEDNNAYYQQNYGDSTAATLGNITGATAVTAPLLMTGGGAVEGLPLIGRGLTSLRGLGIGGRAAANALTGAAQGAGGAALLSGGNNAPLSDQVTAGGIIGAALGPVAPLVSKAGGAIYRNLFMRNPEAAQAAAADIAPILAKEGVDITKLTPEVQASVQKEAAAQAANGSMDAAALARKANMEDLGLKPTQGMMTRDPIQWANEQEAAKQAGSPLLQAMQENNAALRTHLADISKNSGGVTSTAEDAGDSALNAVTSKFKEWQGDVSNAYKQVEQEVGPDKNVALSGLRDALEPLSDKTAGIPVVDAIKRRLSRYGVIDKDGNWKDNLTVGNAEELRKFIAEEASTDPAVNRIVRNLQNVLDDDVQKSTGSDAFGAARQLAAKRFGEIDASKINSAIMDEKVNPAQFVQKFVVGKSTASQDLDAFKKTLTTGTPDQIARGTQAFNDLKQQTAHWIQSQATNGALDEGQISYPRLKQALEAIGPKKLQIMFGDDGAAQYAKILKAAHDSSYTPGKAPVNTSNTTNALVNAVKTGAFHAAAHVPGVGLPLRIAAGMNQLGKNAMEANQQRQFVENALKGTPMPNKAVGTNPLTSAIGIPAATNYLFQRPQSQMLGNEP